MSIDQVSVSNSVSGGKPVTTDVAIIGGGLSGVYLAWLLGQQGIDYVLLEAKPTLGGRILSGSDSVDTGLGVDLGPTWFWPHQQRVQTLLETLGVPWFEQYTQGDVLYQMDGNVQRSAGAGAMTSYRIRGGMQTLVDVLAETLTPESVWIDHVVTHLDKLSPCRLDTDGSGAAHSISGDGAQNHRWSISASHHGQSKTLLAQRVIVATPPRVLLQHTNVAHYLPQSLTNILQATSTWMAAQAKFVARYDEPFWRNDRLSGDVFSRVGPMVEIHDASADEDGGYALFGFVGVPAHVRQQHDDELLVQHCTNQLIDIFGEVAAKPQAAYIKDWSKDEFVVTAKDITDAPMHPQINLLPFVDDLAKLHLFFSGTEYAKQEGGYVEGALESADDALTWLMAR